MMVSRNGYTTDKKSLFRLLNDITPQGVLALALEYSSEYRYYPMATDIIAEGFTPLACHEDYFFDADRVVSMVQGVQTAVRKVAEIETGRIEVLEAGHGLGYIALGALALNEELDGRVHVTGIENNPATAVRVAEILGDLGIPPSWITIHNTDARTFGDVPDNTHILVAEHVSRGLFSKEPLYPIQANLIPQLTEPRFIIPDGLEVYARVVEDPLSFEELKDRFFNRFKKNGLSGSLPFRTIFAKDHLDLDSRLLVEPQYLGRINFEDVLTGGWDGNVNFTTTAMGVRNGQGAVEVRNVPTFPHEVSPDHVLSDIRFYWYKRVPSEVVAGTSINHWGPVTETGLLQAYLDSPQSNIDFLRMGSYEFSKMVYFDLCFVERHQIQKNAKHKISIKGEACELTANTSIDNYIEL